MLSGKSLIITFFLLLIYFQGAAQQSSDSTISLKQALHEITEVYEVRFSYIEEKVEAITLTPLKDFSSLEECLSYMESTYPLEITPIHQQLYSVQVTLPSNICAYVMDGKTSLPLPYASLKSNYTQGLTDENAYFQWPIHSITDTLTISYTGYQSLSIPLVSIDADSCRYIALSPKSLTMDEVIIEDYILKGIQQKLDGNITLQLPAMNMVPGLAEKDALHSLQVLPGIYSVQETVSGLNIRGGTHDQNLILWEGLRMYQSGHFFGLISAFNPTFTQEVSVLKGGRTAAWGEGVSGSISLKNKEKHISELNTSAHLNLLSAGVGMQIPINSRNTLQLSTRRSIADLWRSPTYQKYYERAFRGTDVFQANENTDSNTEEDFQFHDINLHYSFQRTAKEAIHLDFMHIQNDISYAESGVYNEILTSRESSLQQRQQAAGITYQKQWNEALSSELRLGGTLYLLSGINHDIAYGQEQQQQNEVTDLQLQLKGDYQFSPLLQIQFGYQASEVGIRSFNKINIPSLLIDSRNVTVNQAVFGDVSWNNRRQTTYIQAGVRGNHYQKAKAFTLEPRLRLRQTITPFYAIAITAESSSQSILQLIDQQQDFLGVEKRRWVMANNENIPLLKGKQLSLENTFKKKGVLLSAEIYWKKIDGILSKSQGFLNQYTYTDTQGKYDTYGLDVLVNYQYKTIGSWLSYSLSESNYTFPALSTSFFPNNVDLRHIASTGISYNHYPWAIAYGLHWHSGLPYTPAEEINEETIIYSTPNSARLSAYSRMDLSAKYTFTIGKVTGNAGLSLWNTFNKENIIEQYYRQDQVKGIISQTQFALMRTPNLQVGVTLMW
ncbi:TonB-dependent receptor [Algivirga pacifica]|uniref:TonB-dependent receptor n=1 Tax=Algivirga pacifica TaxID=1162670 RepID=A0ABP9DL61_9BACT